MLWIIYGISLVAGGALVALSAFAGGDHSFDADGSIDGIDAHIDGGIDAHIDGAIDGGIDGGIDGHIDGGNLDVSGHEVTDISTTDVASGMVASGNLAPRWRPLKEVRFWTFFAAFFGLSGVLFKLFGTFALLPLEVITSVLLGSGSGLLASYVMYAMSRRETNSMASLTDYNGAVGKVLLPLGAGEPGKVRLNVRGQLIDLPAITGEDEELKKGDEILVTNYDIKAKMARVTKLSQG